MNSSTREQTRLLLALVAGQEVHAWAAVRPHPSIVRYYTSWLEAADAAGGEYGYIALERCDVSLWVQMSVGLRRFKEPELLQVLKQARRCSRQTDRQSMGCAVPGARPAPGPSGQAGATPDT
jgi:hypothetical protein